MVRALASRLSRTGIEAHIATTDDNGPEQLRVPLGVPVVEDGVTYWYFRRQTRFYTFSWPLTAWLIRHVREFDLVHIHALFSYAALPAAFLARRYGVPYIVRPLGTLNEWGMKTRRPWIKQLSFGLIESRILKHAAIVHYTSEQERVEAGSLQIATPAAIIPNTLPDHPDTVEAGAFRGKHPELRDRNIILFLSRLDAKKGLELLLPAFARVHRQFPNTILVLAGNGTIDFVNQLKQQASSLNIERDVFWAGFLSGTEKWAALRDAAVFVLPSHSENFGIAVLEAMAVGVPVVVSDQVGIHREIANADAGLVTSGTIDCLTEALIQILEHPAESSLMGANGKLLAESNYSSEVVVKKLMHVYNAIAN
jgi:glycosyltransferase involved in cell wall biosynthesis